MIRTHSENKLMLQTPPQGGERELEATRAALLSHAEARASDHRDRCARAEAIRAEERRAVAQIFGGKSEAYKKACAAWRTANRLEGISEASLADEEIRGRAARSVQEGRAVLSRLGVNVARLEEVHAKSRAALDALRPASPPGAPPVEFLPEEEVPLKIRTHNTSPWVLRRPPYDGWSWWHSWSYRGGNDHALEGYLNSNTGDLGHRSSWSLNSSNDDDFLRNDHAHNVGIWHWVDAPGPVEVWAKVRCAVTHSLMSLWEEFWQWSSAYVSHVDYLALNVSPSIYDANLTRTWSSWRQQGDDAFYQSINPIPSNNVYWIHMVTTQPVPGKAWAWIQVGSRGSHYAAMNDTIGGTTLQSRWFFEEIYYRIL